MAALEVGHVADLVLGHEGGRKEDHVGDHALVHVGALAFHEDLVPEGLVGKAVLGDEEVPYLDELARLFHGT